MKIKPTIEQLRKELTDAAGGRLSGIQMALLASAADIAEVLADGETPGYARGALYRELRMALVTLDPSLVATVGVTDAELEQLLDRWS